MPELTFLQAISRGIWEEMEADKSVFLMGEDIGRYGGAFKVTEGFLDKFGPERVIETPLAEEGFVGAAIGAAYVGLRPVVEFQFIDFIACAFDPIVNFACTSRYRWGQGVPVTFRGPWGGATKAGPFHSRNVEMWFAHSPGIKVVAPSTPTDAKGLIKACIRDNDPCLFLEHKALYRRIKEDVPDQSPAIPIGKARIVREGSGLTIVTYGFMVHRCLEALVALQDLSIELIDLRTIYPLDRSAIVESVKKTSKIMVVHEDTRTGGLAGEIAATVNEEAFEHLDGPVVRVTSPDTPVPSAPSMEEVFLPSVKDIVEAARKLAAY
ncbi:MAG TPA: alpha-ketoacid dehydrogenase subunit beta [Planctomycetota bacterium]|nr:alpha-ketoacid dehydrogenase subunit beta [Planctomycetota bacterium]